MAFVHGFANCAALLWVSRLLLRIKLLASGLIPYRAHLNRGFSAEIVVSFKD